MILPTRSRQKQMEEAQRRIDEWVRQNDTTKPLNLMYLGLKELPPLPINLTQLYCGDNILAELLPLPVGLTHLYCDSNNLTHLPPLPTSLTWLYCGSNNLTSFPALPAGLTKLYCSNNSLIYPPQDKIDKLSPDSLVEWMCKNPYTIVKSANKRN